MCTHYECTCANQKNSLVSLPIILCLFALSKKKSLSELKPKYSGKSQDFCLLPLSLTGNSEVTNMQNNVQLCMWVLRIQIQVLMLAQQVLCSSLLNCLPSPVFLVLLFILATQLHLHAHLKTYTHAHSYLRVLS